MDKIQFYDLYDIQYYVSLHKCIDLMEITYLEVR